VVLAADESPIICGNSLSSNFPTTPGAIDETPNGGQDAIVSMLDPNATSLLYSTVLGGSSDDYGNGFAISPSGEVVIAGSTRSPAFPVTAGAYDVTHNGMQDIFLTRINFSSSTPVWSTFLGGTENDEPFAFILDRNDQPIVSGQADSPNFPVTLDAFDISYNGGGDAYLTRLDPTGSSLSWSSFLGGAQLDQGWELYLHPSGDPILAGPTYSGEFPTTPGAFDRTHAGATDVFLSRFTIPVASGVEDEWNDHAGISGPLWIGPNPVSERVHIRFALPSAEAVTIRAFDAAGRCVAVIEQAARAAGLHAVTWDGRDHTGRPVASGTYWIRMEGPLTSAHRKLVILR
jgi:hypothetical protein